MSRYSVLLLTDARAHIHSVLYCIAKNRIDMKFVRMCVNKYTHIFNGHDSDSELLSNLKAVSARFASIYNCIYGVYIVYRAIARLLMVYST